MPAAPPMRAANLTTRAARRPIGAPPPPAPRGHMTNRKPLPAIERLPLLEPDLQPNPIKLASHRHRHALQTLMHLIFKLKFTNHLNSQSPRLATLPQSCNMQLSRSSLTGRL